MGVCTFCGHGHIYGSYEAVQQECYTTVENLIKTGDVDCFLIGNYGDFDSIAASVCLSLKKTISSYYSKPCFAVLPSPSGRFHKRAI